MWRWTFSAGHAWSADNRVIACGDCKCPGAWTACVERGVASSLTRDCLGLALSATAQWKSNGCWWPYRAPPDRFFSRLILDISHPVNLKRHIRAKEVVKLQVSTAQYSQSTSLIVQEGWGKHEVEWTTKEQNEGTKVEFLQWRKHYKGVHVVCRLTGQSFQWALIHFRWTYSSVENVALFGPTPGLNKWKCL